MNFDARKEIKEYYGEILASSEDLKTDACCTTDSIPEHHKKILSEIHDEVLMRFYGCGSPIPPDVYGRTVLDLGCGTGRDAYLLSKLVGPDGKVIGVDMTDEQLNVAKKYVDWHADKFGLEKTNVEFHKGYIEDLGQVTEDESVDVVVSNCVINLSTEKRKVFSEIFRVLKQGGELYFSDVFADRRIPEALQRDKVIVGECLGGAMYIEDFRRMLREMGCLDYRIVAKSKIEVQNEALQKRLGNIQFYSLTIRAFKLGEVIEDICEDYGQVAVYNGTIEETPHQFLLDDHHLFQTGKPMLVCGNTAAMIGDTRYGKHFSIMGDRSVHFGAFDCGDGIDSSLGGDDVSGACC